MLQNMSSCVCGSCFGSTGEASNVDEYLWLMGRARYKPVIEYCGGTEIGGGFITGSLLQSQSLAAFSTPAMGCSLFILDNNGHPIVSTTAAKQTQAHATVESLRENDGLH